LFRYGQNRLLQIWVSQKLPVEMEEFPVQLCVSFDCGEVWKIPAQCQAQWSSGSASCVADGKKCNFFQFGLPSPATFVDKATAIAEHIVWHLNKRPPANAGLGFCGPIPTLELTNEPCRKKRQQIKSRLP
jgi:hypothetical protein